MKLKKHGAFLANFVIDLANGDMSQEAFDMDYSTCSWMTDEAFQDAIGDAVDAFLGNAPVADIYCSSIAWLP